MFQPIPNGESHTKSYTMKWDPDKACVELEKWTGISAEIRFTRRTLSEALADTLSIPVDKTGRLVVCELSVLTDGGRKNFLSRTFRGAFLVARKALRPRVIRKRKVDRRPRRPVER